MLLVKTQFRSWPAQALRAMFGTALLLMLPLLAMQLSSEVLWGPADFAAAAVLLFVTLFTVQLAWRLCLPGLGRRLTVFFLVATAMLIWAELAVGIFW